MELFLLPCVATGVSLLAVGCLIGATASGAAVDICSDTPAWVQRAGRAANGGVVDVPRALAGAPHAPRMTAQRGARFAPLSYPQLLATTAMTSRETVGVISRPKRQSVDRTAPLPS